ncbi:MAG: ATP-grasp domain-containing protein [Candidatus Omnitrophica bacterium]|nr:ATP-grasp domain-containing protein [Candidatus Omnitrophota bacterium]
MGYRVALTFNLKKPSLAKERFLKLDAGDEDEKGDDEPPPDSCSEFDSPETVNAIAGALREGGNTVFLVEANEDLPGWFQNNKVDIVFNVAEGNSGDSRESQVPAILEYMNIPYTGSGILTLAMALDKAVSKKIFRYEGIPTPEFQVFRDGNEELMPGLKFPLIVKPNSEGSAKGIHANNVVANREELYSRVRDVIRLYKQEALAEEFIEGKELTVGILGNGHLRVLPVLEIDFSNCKESGDFFYSWRMKEFQGDEERHLNPDFYCPARIPGDIKEKVEKVAMAAHKALNCLDLSRTDIRLKNDGTPYVLEVNPLPGLDPEESNLTFMTKSAGIEYNSLINGILRSAMERRSNNNGRVVQTGGKPHIIRKEAVQINGRSK